MHLPMIFGHYILWRSARNAGPVDLFYVLAIAAVLVVIIEVVDRIRKFVEKKKKQRNNA